MKLETALRHANEIARRLVSVNGLIPTPRGKSEFYLVKKAWRRWSRVPTLIQIGMKRPNRTRALRAISAIVGKGWPQRFCQRCGAVLRVAPPKTGQTEKYRATDPEQAPKQTPICRPVMPQPRGILV